MNRTVLTFLLLLGIAATALAQKRPGRVPADVAAISAALTRDKAAIASAISEIDALLETQPALAAGQLRSWWINTLIVNAFHEDSERLAIAAMAELAYDTYSLEQLQRLRIRNFMTAGRMQDAVSAAKGLFYIASLPTTRAALLQLAECLSAAHPEDPSIVNRLRREQFAATQPTAVPSTQALDLLMEIRIDPLPFARALERYDTGRYAIEANPYRNRVATGNLLLLSDRADEARAAFEQALPLADQESKMAALQNIARAIKAQTRSIGSANRWLQQALPPQQ